MPLIEAPPGRADGRRTAPIPSRGIRTPPFPVYLHPVSAARSSRWHGRRRCDRGELKDERAVPSPEDVDATTWALLPTTFRAPRLGRFSRNEGKNTFSSKAAAIDL